MSSIPPGAATPALLHKTWTLPNRSNDALAACSTLRHQRRHKRYRIRQDRNYGTASRRRPAHRPQCAASITFMPDRTPEFDPNRLSSEVSRNDRSQVAASSGPKCRARNAPILSDTSVLKTIDRQDRSFVTFAVIVGCGQLPAHGDSIALLDHIENVHVNRSR